MRKRFTAVPGAAKYASPEEEANYLHRLQAAALRDLSHSQLDQEVAARLEKDYACSLIPGASLSSGCTACTHLKRLSIWQSSKPPSEANPTFTSSIEALGLPNGP